MKTVITSIIVLIAGFAMAQTEVIKMKGYGGKIIIKAELNGKKEYFLVDTGADISVLNSKLLEKFDMQSIKNFEGGKAVGFNGASEEIELVKNAVLKIGESINHKKFYTMDISKLVHFIELKTSYEISGIIGSDVLRAYNGIIDYNSREIILTNNKGKRLAMR